MFQDGEMSDALKQLAELLEGSGLKVTFSRWCISGLVPDCACWRCLKDRGIDSSDETERAAEERSKRESAAFRKRVTEHFRWATTMLTRR